MTTKCQYCGEMALAKLTLQNVPNPKERDFMVCPFHLLEWTINTLRQFAEIEGIVNDIMSGGRGS